MKDRNHTYLYTVRVTDACMVCKHRHFGKCRSEDCECPRPDWREAQVEAFAGLDQVATKLHVKLDYIVYVGKEIVQ